MSGFAAKILASNHFGRQRRTRVWASDLAQVPSAIRRAAELKGWSVKRTILGQPVYNEKDESVGSVDENIFVPCSALLYRRKNTDHEEEFLGELA